MTLSKKLLIHMENPTFWSKNSQIEECVLEEFEIDKKAFALQMSGSLDENGIVKINGFFSDLDPLGNGIIDAICELINERAFFMVADLKPRELESFLRDRNDCHAYSTEDLTFSYYDKELLCRVQMCLSKIIAENLHSQFVKIPTNHFQKSHLIERMKTLEDIRQTLLFPLLKQFQIDLQFTELWGNQLYYRINLPSHRESKSMREFFHNLFVHLFSYNSGLSSLNWVAELD